MLKLIVKLSYSLKNNPGIKPTRSQKGYLGTYAGNSNHKISLLSNQRMGWVLYSFRKTWHGGTGKSCVDNNCVIKGKWIPIFFCRFFFFNWKLFKYDFNHGTF